MKSLGFTLIETLIYIFLSSLLILTIFQFAAQNYSKYGSKYKNCTQKTMYWTALDLLDNDIRQCLYHGYKKQQREEIIFSTKDHEVGWKLDQDRLYRTIGKYNPMNDTWADKTESLVAKDIHRLEFRVSENQKLLKTTIEFKINNFLQKIENLVSTRSEVFLISI